MFIYPKTLLLFWVHIFPQITTPILYYCLFFAIFDLCTMLSLIFACVFSMILLSHSDKNIYQNAYILTKIFIKMLIYFPVNNYCMILPAQMENILELHNLAKESAIKFDKKRFIYEDVKNLLCPGRSICADNTQYCRENNQPRPSDIWKAEHGGYNEYRQYSEVHKPLPC